METSYLHAISGNDVRYRLAQTPTAAEAGEQEFSFDDLLDVINPLQHLPIISSLYREATGDTISGGARMAGGYLFGGPAGLLMASLNAGLQILTGGDAGEHLLAFLGGNDAERKYAQAAYQKANDLS